MWIQRKNKAMKRWRIWKKQKTALQDRLTPLTQFFFCGGLENFCVPSFRLIKNLPLQNNGIQTQKTRKKITKFTKLEHFFV